MPIAPSIRLPDIIFPRDRGPIPQNLLIEIPFSSIFSPIPIAPTRAPRHGSWPLKKVISGRKGALGGGGTPIFSAPCGIKWMRSRFCPSREWGHRLYPLAMYMRVTIGSSRGSSTYIREEVFICSLYRLDIFQVIKEYRVQGEDTS